MERFYDQFEARSQFTNDLLNDYSRDRVLRKKRITSEQSNSEAENSETEKGKGNERDGGRGNETDPSSDRREAEVQSSFLSDPFYSLITGELNKKSPALTEL